MAQGQELIKLQQEVEHKMGDRVSSTPQRFEHEGFRTLRFGYRATYEGFRTLSDNFGHSRTEPARTAFGDTVACLLWPITGSTLVAS